MCTALINMDVMYGEDIIQVIKDLDTDGNGTIGKRLFCFLIKENFFF
jgi:hypothetical protein